MNNLNVRKGDNVKVLTGKDKDLYAQRFMAWRGLDLCDLGFAAWNISNSGKGVGACDEKDSFGLPYKDGIFRISAVSHVSYILAGGCCMDFL